MALTRWSKFWVTVTLLSLLVYTVRWLYGNALVVHDAITNPQYAFNSFSPYWVWIDPVFSGLIGGAIRLVGVLFALFAVYLAWGPKQKPFFAIKRYVALAVLFEALYQLIELPITILVFARGVAPILMLAFTLQILIVAPTLIVLSRRTWSYSESDGRSLLRWVAVASIGYLVGIWINNVFRWFSMANSASIALIFSGSSLWGFLMTIATLSLSVAFAVAGFYSWLNRQDKKLGARLLSVALIMLGLYFVLYILYSALTNTLNYVILVEIWPIPLLGLGLVLLFKKHEQDN